MSIHFLYAFLVKKRLEVLGMILEITAETAGKHLTFCDMCFKVHTIYRLQFLRKINGKILSFPIFKIQMLRYPLF